MKFIFSILIFFSSNLQATIYYVANSGNDLNNGTSKATPWRTIRKVNESAFLPGDRILFLAGNVWNEKLVISSSGKAGAAITFGRYGKGSKPVITGLQTQTGFTHQGNIWTVNASKSLKDLNVVLINGSIKAKARYPNTGYLTITSYAGKNQITGSLTGTPDYSGAEAVVRSTHWTIDVSRISSQSNGTLNLATPLSYVPTLGGNGYFIQNSPWALDIPGEWTYDTASKILKVYANFQPSVQIAATDTLIDIENKEYITFDGLSIQGANEAAVLLRSTNNITIQNCSLNYSGKLGAISGYLSRYVSIINDSIQNSLSNAICLLTSDFNKPGCDYAIVNNNYIKNSGTMPGMVPGRYIQYYGIFISGIQPTITNNRIDSSGYSAISFCGPRALIKNNYITNFCFIKDDGGGIYTVIGRVFPANYSAGSIIRSNIVMNGIGAPAGTSTSNIPSAGIYLDDDSRQIIVDSNTVANCNASCICLNSASDITLRENNIVNGIGAGLAIYGKDNTVTDLTIKQNKIYAQNAKHNNILRWSGSSIGDMDSNYYARPFNKNNIFNISDTQYNFPDWNSTTGHDKHSIQMTVNTAGSTPLFYINPTKKDSTISLNGTYIDLKGKKFINSITLHSFSSSILFKAL